MEIEVKFRLDHQNHQKLLSLLDSKAKFKSTERQENYFIDSCSRELDGKRINFRIRIINKQTAIITIKGKGIPV
jgi:adenylate cyclase class IV